MTAVLDTLSATMEQLVETCQRSQRGFKAAAEAAQSTELRRLLNLYSHQRTRFAGELKAECRLSEEQFLCNSESADEEFSGKSDTEILDSCLAQDSDCLAAYSRALSKKVPGRAQFLIAAQFSLMQQVHARMRSLATPSVEQPKVTTVSHSL